jgi:hypothetical protein
MSNKWQSVNMLVAVCFFVGLMPSGPLDTSANAHSARAAQSTAPQSKVPRVRVYVAVLKKPIELPLIRPDTGTVSVKGGCLIATVGGVDRTVVLPPYARLIGPTSNPTGIRMLSETVPVGIKQLLPALRALYLLPSQLSELKEPIPDHCPKAVEIFAG